MANPQTRLVALILACLFFGYAIVNSLVFYQRGRHPEAYRSRSMADFVGSPRYGKTVWLSGMVGVAGFAFASWRLVILILTMMHAR
jgi:hypothetical protein